jgi:DNA/RNA endonuclease G (NUC1)
MRGFLTSSVVAGLLLVGSSCAHDITVAPDGLIQGRSRVFFVMPDVRISEIHYDNIGTDAGERIEISGPAGTNLTGWSIVLYNGSNGAVYDTDALTGLIPATCESRGVVVLTYPSNGIQNGGDSPDGIALLNSGALVEFLSYEGAFAATNGPANGATSTDMGVSQSGSEPLGSSLQRNGSDAWTATSGTNTFGACNDHEVPPPPGAVATVTVEPASATVTVGGSRALTATAFDSENNEVSSATFTWSSSDADVATVSEAGVAIGVAPGDAVISASAGGKTGTAAIHVVALPPDPALGSVFISEFHYDNSGADVDERVEVAGPAGLDLSGWKIVLYNGNGGASYGMLALSGVLENQCGGRGLTSVAAPAMQNGEPDGLALVSPRGTVFEFLSYEGVFTATNGEANRQTSTDIGRSESGEAPGRSLQKDDIGWYGPAPASFGLCNSPPPPFVNVFGRDFDDPPLPVGFEFQLFADYNNGRGDEVPATFTWTTDNAALLSVDQDGVVRALGVGSGVIRATAADQTVGTFTVATQLATPSTTAQYGNHTEFGVPTDDNASDDHVVRYEQYTASYNKDRNTPNWVSFNLETSHIGANRCDCFTFDQSLPAQFQRYTTADYVGSRNFYGFQYDRGHLVRSFDRAGVLDNARTFYFTNIIPQTADNNQGPWSDLELHLGAIAQSPDKELYVIAGVAGSLGKLMDGIITIPAFVWKVAVIMPRNNGLATVRTHSDIEVVAVIMPNIPNPPAPAPPVLKPWPQYLTTVNAVEALSGYDILDLLENSIESVVEAGMQDELGMIDALVAAGTISAGNGAALSSKLEAAAASLDRGNRTAAVNQLEAFLNQIDALGRSRRLSDANVAALRSAIRTLIESFTS